METNCKTTTIRITGSILREGGWEENLVLRVEEGFKSRREAAAWAWKAMKELKTSTQHPSRWVFDRAY